MKRLIKAAAILGSLAGGTTASALPVTLTDVVTVQEWLTVGKSVSWEHDFVFDPPYEVIYDARLTVSFYDDEKDTRRLSTKEYAIGGTDGGFSLSIGEVDTGSRTFNIGVNQVKDGVLGVWVKSLFGDFGIYDSTLRIRYSARESAVSSLKVAEPDTLGLLGAGLLVVGAWRRRSLKRI